MHLKVCRLVYEDAEGLGPDDVLSIREAERILGSKLRNLLQLVDEGRLTLLIDADAPRGWAWRWLLLRSEVEKMADEGPSGGRHRGLER